MSNYSHAHRKAREALLADNPACVYCGADATVADHQPPVAMHEHHEGSGCCTYVPSCSACSYKQAGEVSEAKRKAFGGKAVQSDMVTFTEPDPSPPPVDPMWAVEWMTDLLEVPADATWPRWMTAPHPRAVGSYGAGFERWAEARSGSPLRWWQRLVARRVLEHDESGRLVWLLWFVSVARQLGKTHLMAELLVWATVHVRDHWQADSVLFTSRSLLIAEGVLQPLMDYAGEDPEWKAVRSQGSKGINHLPTNHRLLIRSTKSVYGSTNGLAVVDESWDVPASHVTEGIRPTLIAAEGMLGLTSTAHRLATSLSLNERERAFDQIEDPKTRLILEWSTDRNLAHDDPDGWRQASPHWTPFREEMIDDAYRAAMSGELLDPTEPDPVAGFTAQYLNQWPIRQARRGVGDPLLEPGQWAAALSTTELPTFQKVIGVEDNYGRGLSVAVVGLSPGERVAIEGRSFVDVESGWQWLLSQADGATAFAVGASLMTDGTAHGLPQMEPGTSVLLRTGLAAFRQLCADGVVAHAGTDDLSNQVMGCRVREGSAGLQIVSRERRDLVKATAYAVAELQRQRASVPRVW